MKWIDKLLGFVPLDYEKGYIDGFAAGLKFYKESIDMMHNAVLKSDKVREEMIEQSKIRRKENGREKN
jgi:hypothetical protein